MIKSIPATWDETIVLPPSEIGEIAALARRKGKDWFLAILNGPERRQADVSLAFLPDGQYEAMIVRDVPDEPAAVKMDKANFRNKDSVKLDLVPGGGFMARLTAAN
jgi:alpha-glucosidase